MHMHTPHMRLAVLGDHQPPGMVIIRDKSWAASSTQTAGGIKVRIGDSKCKPLLCNKVRVIETKRRRREQPGKSREGVREAEHKP